MIGIYTNFNEFLEETKKLGVEANLEALLNLDVLFLQDYGEYTVINLRDFSDAPNNLLVLSFDRSLLYSEKQITHRDFRLFKYTVQKKFGESTALILLAMKEVLKNYFAAFDKINTKIDGFADLSHLTQIEETTKELRRFTDKVEDFVNIALELEDRKIKVFKPEYVTYDYDVIIAKAKLLLDRCRNHLNELRDIRSEIELKNTHEMNKRIENLTDVMKKLTALTLVLMIPNIIAGHFGMNFRYMPELFIPWAYPAVIAGSLLITACVAYYMHRIGWL